MKNNKLRNKIISSLNSNITPTPLLLIEGNFINPKHDFFADFATTLQDNGLAKINHQEFYPYKINGHWVWPGDRIGNGWIKKLNKVLCCNTVPDNLKCKPLIYFPKQYKNILSLKDNNRDIKYNIVWCGSNYRSRERSNYHLIKYCDYSWTAGWVGTRKASKQKPMLSFLEYIELLSSSKFCLCLPGFGPKCHREIEAMAVGSVPIFTPGCCTRYYNKLREGIHYLTAENHQDIDKIKKTSDSQWMTLSNNCKKWFNDNIAPEGAHKTILKAINEH